MSTTLTQTSGHWWTPEGWLTGVCVHDAHVGQLQTDETSNANPLSSETPGTEPLFIPAPVDLHVHGGGGHDCMSGDDAIRAMLVTHAQHGTGSLLATSVTAPFDVISQFLDSVARVMSDPDQHAATLLGAHLEGPFINPDKLGAQPPHSAKLNLAQLESWFESGVVRVITYAPELDPEGELISLCHQYRVRVQIGHTLCTWSQAQQALQRGCGVTHLYNAMSGVSHRQGGAATAALAYADYAEIIIDGLHVERAAFDAARRAIPGLYSITDATAASAMPDGEYQLGSLWVNKVGDRVLLADGTLAGSCLTQLRSLSVLRAWDVGWHDIASMVSVIPARWIGDEKLGQIVPGAHAHWLEIQDDKPVALWLAGQRLAF